MSLRLLALTVSATAIAFFAGCQKKPTQAEVLQKYREPLEKFRMEIASYADLLEVDQRKPDAPPDPKPVFNFGNSSWSAKESGPVKSNLCILPAAALEDLTKVWRHSFSNNVRLDNNLGHVFSLLDGTTVGQNDKADRDFEPQVQGLLQTRYIGLFKERKYVPAKLEENKTFVPGAMTGDVWLVDRPSRKLLFHGLVFATNGEQVSVLHDRMRSLSKDQWGAELFVDIKEKFLLRTMLVLTRGAGVEFRGWVPEPDPAKPNGAVPSMQSKNLAARK